jgi:hypothetical protein
MASIYKRNGIWYVAIFVAGKRVYRSTGTRRKSEAHRFLASFNNLPQKPTEACTLRDFSSKFLDYSAVNHARNSVRLFRQILNNFLKLGPSLRLGDIASEHVDRCKTIRLRQVKPVSVNVELRMLRSSLLINSRLPILDNDEYVAANRIAGLAFFRLMMLESSRHSAKE